MTTRPDLAPGFNAGRLRMSRRALAGLLRIVDPEEIGVAFLLGRADPDGWSVRDVVAVPNVADLRYPHKARGDLRPRQSAWAFHAETRDAIEAGAAETGDRIVAVAHTHRHGRTAPSTLDWRRVRAVELGAIVHGHSGLVTLYRRGTVKGPGAIVYRGRVPTWSAAVQSFCAAPTDLPAPLSSYPEIERCKPW